MRYFFSVLLFFVEMTFVSPLACAQDTSPRSAMVFIDPSKLSNEQLNFLYSTLLEKKIHALDKVSKYFERIGGTKSNQNQQLFENSLAALELKKKTVRQNEAIDLILKSQVNFASNKMARQISELNDLKNPNSISIGQQLLFPDLPTLLKPSKNQSSQSRYYQLFNISSDDYKSYLADRETDSLFALKEDNSDFAKLNNAFLWSFRFDLKEQAIKLAQDLPESKLAELTGAFVVVDDDPRFQAYSFPEETAKNNDSLFETVTNLNLSMIPEKHFGDLVVFDVFEGNCSHGHKVVEIIKQTFREYGIGEEIEKKIKLAPINFFSDFDNNIKFLEDYSKELSGLNREEAQHMIKILKRDRRDCIDCVPEYYLSALFKAYFERLKPDIITTSFSLIMEKYGVIPRAGLGGSTNLLTASPNYSDKEIEDYLTSKKATTKDIEVKLQPVYDYYYHYAKSGTLIVGSAKNTKELFGTFSRDGEGVHAMGRPSGWGSENSCIKKNEIGNSFSTPDVAAKLFIAKAFWRSKDLSVSAIEARNRLLISSEPKKEFIGKISAAGTINLEKLVAGQEGFLEIDGAVRPIYITEDYNQITLANKRTYEFGIDVLSVFSGVFIDSSGQYLFHNKTQTWRKYDIEALNISVSVDGYKKKLDLKGDIHLALFQQPKNSK